MPCDTCPLESAAYQALTKAVSDPLYQAASDYLNRHELGLTRYMREPIWWVQEAIIFIASERARIREKMHKWKSGNDN